MLPTTKRHALQPMDEPIYQMSQVPRARRGLEGSVVVEVSHRDHWISLLGEVLLLCNEAAGRRKASQYVPPGHRGKPLSLEYIADRFDLDDPLRGYCVRSEVEGWLQGFVTVTDFTTWQSWFRWDSLRRDAEITDDSIDYLHEADDETETRDWMKQRVRDLDGRIAWELSQQVHDGDNEQEGVVWPRIAEISLLAGMGCGSWLLQLVIDELEAPGGKYQWIVLQASENAVSFYERFGFVRVGAVARYDPPKESKKNAAAQASQENPSISDEEDEESEEEISDDSDAEVESDDNSGAGTGSDSGRDSGSGSDSDGSSDSGSDSDSGSGTDSDSDSDSGSSDSSDDAKSDNSDDDNDDDTPDSKSKPLDPREQRALRRRLLQEQQEAAAREEEELAQISQGSAHEPNGQSSMKRIGKQPTSSTGPPEIKGICSDFFWYCAKDDESPNSIAKKFRVDVHDLLFINARVIQLAPGSKLYGGTYLRVPKHGKPYDATVVFSRAAEGNDSSGGKAMSTSGQVPGFVPPIGGSPYYFALNDETPQEIAEKIGVDVKDLVNLNKTTFKGLFRKSKLLENTKLLIPGRELTQEDKDNEELPPIVPYRHWTFQDDKVEFTPPSFMMARRIVRRKRTDGQTRAEKLLVEKKVDMPPLISGHRGKQAEPENNAVEDFDEEEIAAASAAEIAAKFKAENDRLMDEAHIPVKVKFHFAGSKLKVDRVGPLKAEVPNSVSARTTKHTDTKSEKEDLENLVGKKRVCQQGEFEGTRTMQVYLNRCAYIPARTALLCKELRPVPPEKPRGRTSCYMYFNNDARRRLAKKHPDLKVTEISKMVSEQWKKLSEDEKAPYMAKSEVDRIRYAREREVYKRELEEFQRKMDELYPDPNKKPPEKPRPPPPDKPRGRTSCYMYFNNEVRPGVSREHPELKVTEISKLVASKWKSLSEEDKAPYRAESEIDKKRYLQDRKKYEKKLKAYNIMIEKMFPSHTEKKKKKDKDKEIEKPKGVPMLINKVVKVALKPSEESGWQYYFVLTYIPDLQWCRLAPMHPCGVFKGEKNGIARGRIRWKLVEEGRALELDISAKRCSIVKTRVMRGTPNADMEGESSKLVVHHFIIRLSCLHVHFLFHWFYVYSFICECQNNIL